MMSLNAVNLAYLLAIFCSFFNDCCFLKKGCVKSVATEVFHFLEFSNNTTHEYEQGRKEWNCRT